ncbi:S-layer homology domain-containing protein [Paenibacillus alkalitolerans]|nr:S-layer homology domain-containing protein [Paenibacillus alkalitolerans]
MNCRIKQLMSLFFATLKMLMVQGYPDGTFRPNQPITRAEFASLL